jgi:hypothetical protein
LTVFFVGQKIICVNASNWPRWTESDDRPTLPMKGSVYTVRAIAPRIIDGHDEDGLHLAEIVNPVRDGRSPNGVWKRSELAFRQSRFRPLRASNIDVFLEMLEPAPSVEVVTS